MVLKQGPVSAVRGQESVVCAFFELSTVTHDDNLVGITNRRKAMSDDSDPRQEYSWRLRSGRIVKYLKPNYTLMDSHDRHANCLTFVF